MEYIDDIVTRGYTSADVTAARWVKLFSVSKTARYNEDFVFDVYYTYYTGTYNTGHKRIAYIVGTPPKLVDFNYEAYGISVKVLDNTTEYLVYAKITLNTAVSVKFVHCDIPNLIVTFPGALPEDLPALTDVTSIKIIDKSAKTYSLLTLTVMSTGFTRQYGSQLTLTDENEIWGHLYVNADTSARLADGTQICSLPAPLYVSTVCNFRTFCAQYKGSDGYWYGCTVQLGSDGALKIYDVGANVPASTISIKMDLNYRCAKSVIQQFITG